MRFPACILASAALLFLPACSFQPGRPAEEVSDVYISDEVLDGSDQLIRRYLRALKADYAALQDDAENESALRLHIINSQALALLDTAQRHQALRDLSQLALKVTRAEYERIRISLSHKDSLAQWGYLAYDYRLTDFPGEFGDEEHRSGEEGSEEEVPFFEFEMDSSEVPADMQVPEQAPRDL